MAAEADAPAPAYFMGGHARAMLDDARKPLPTGVADAVSGGGVVSATLTQLTDALTPAADKVPSIGAIVTAITAAGVALSAAALLYRMWAKRHAEALNAALLVTPRQVVATAPAAPVNDNAAVPDEPADDEPAAEAAPATTQKAA